MRRNGGARRGGPVRAAALVADRAIERVLGRGRSRPILVLGAPRSGTTLVAQFLIAALDVGFLSNRERAGWRTPCLSIRRHRAASRFAPSFTSERGVVPGADAPSDGWELFRLCCGAELGDPAADPARLARILRVAE